MGQIEGAIARLEGELEDLREQAEVWRKAVSGKATAALGVGRGAGRRGSSAGATRPRGKNRVNWDEVLSSVPQRFGVEDVMKHPGAAAKGRAQVYPALNRWEATKRIKRVGKGVYEKAGGAGATRGAGAPAKRGPSKKRAVAKKPATAKKRGRPAKAKPTDAKAS
jgi:hypothetical protein